MTSFAHIINPVRVGRESDLYTAQPITFQSVRHAKAFAAGRHDVQLYSVQYAEDSDAVPDGFVRTPDLERSILDLRQFRKPRKLPLIRDIISRGLDAQPDADFYIYSNADIGLMPHFYLSVGRILESGVEALAINRKTVPSYYTSTNELPDIYAEPGVPHEGIDCFVFANAQMARLYFADAIIGSGPVGLCFVTNMLVVATRLLWLEHKDLTFHIGDDKSWTNPILSDYETHNFQQLQCIAHHFTGDVSSPHNVAKREFLESVLHFCQHKNSGPHFQIHPKSLLREVSAMEDYSDSALRRLRVRRRPSTIFGLPRAVSRALGRYLPATMK